MMFLIEILLVIVAAGALLLVVLRQARRARQRRGSAVDRKARPVPRDPVTVGDLVRRVRAWAERRWLSEEQERRPTSESAQPPRDELRPVAQVRRPDQSEML